MDTMKLESLTLYWPMAETEDGQSLFTQEAAVSVEQCYRQFDIWENHYHYKLKYACYDTETSVFVAFSYTFVHLKTVLFLHCRDPPYLQSF